jgi:hypothetical protein
MNSRATPMAAPLVAQPPTRAQLVDVIDLQNRVLLDDAEEHELHAGQALVIPAYTFHWVHGGDDVSIALTCQSTLLRRLRRSGSCLLPSPAQQTSGRRSGSDLPGDSATN